MKRISILLLCAATSLAAQGCAGSPEDNNPGGGDDNPGDENPGEGNEWDRELAKREYDYNAALRIAALRLTGELPTVTEIRQVQNAGDLAAQRAAYEALLEQYMNSPKFARQMQIFWRNTFKMGETAEMDTAPTFAAKLAVQNLSYMNLFTAATGACPTLDAATGTFTDADCAGPGPKAGVLTNQGAMKLYTGNLAFRRVKWIQETFDCVKFPIDQTGLQDVGASVPFTGSYAFNSIAGTDNGGRINFHDVSGVICANCHVNLNHQAPLFAYYDAMGVYQTTLQARTPLPNEPVVQMSDYVPMGEPMSWRPGVLTPDIPSYGAAMAADPDVAKCAVARIWNFAMGHGDVIDLLREVPATTIQAQVDAFTQNGFKVKDMIADVFKADDFVKF